MNKFILALPFIIACQYPEPTNPDPIFDVDQSISGTPNVVDAGQEASIDIADVVSDVPLAEVVSEPKPQNILLIGDSEVLYASWQIKKIQKPNETVFIDSKPGTTIGWWNYDVFHREMSKYRNVDVVIVFLGTNNFNFPYLQPHQNILDEIKARNVKCLWVGPTAVYGKKHIINQLIKDAVSGTCTYVDTEALDIPLADGVHPTPDGTVKWLTEIWKVKDE